MNFKILGPLEVYDGDRLLELGGARQRALLAMLVLHAGEVVSSDQLLAELWASASDDGSPKTLQVTVSRLRRALGSGSLLVTRPPGYQLQLEHGQLDLHLFEDHVVEGRRALGAGDPAAAVHEFTAALDLWRGAPLADFTYESFAQEAIGRLQELHASLMEDRLAAQLELGLHAESVAELQVLTGRFPLRERLREQLMLALYRSGRQADALAVYHDARKALVEQLGIEPGLALQQLESAILAQDPALAYHPASHQTTSADAFGAPDRADPPQIELITPTRSWEVSLEADRTSIGKAEENDVALGEDPTASHLHAVFERFAAGWCVTDLGSSNGTWVNGERIWASRRLRHGDEIRVGQTRMTFLHSQGPAGGDTVADGTPPSLTGPEQDVLTALCRPLLAGDIFTAPASTRSIAEELSLDPAAVKQQLMKLCEKFEVAPRAANRRATLANEAVRRGAVSRAQLRQLNSE